MHEQKHLDLPKQTAPQGRPHKCDVTIAHIDKVITEVEIFHQHITLRNAEWASGE